MQQETPGQDEIRNKIARRAYEIYLERGRQPGHAVEDWLQAEGELQIDKLLQSLAKEKSKRIDVARRATKSRKTICGNAP